MLWHHYYKCNETHKYKTMTMTNNLLAPLGSQLQKEARRQSLSIFKRAFYLYHNTMAFFMKKMKYLTSMFSISIKKKPLTISCPPDHAHTFIKYKWFWDLKKGGFNISYWCKSIFYFLFFKKQWSSPSLNLQSNYYFLGVIFL